MICRWFVFHPSMQSARRFKLVLVTAPDLKTARQLAKAALRAHRVGQATRHRADDAKSRHHAVNTPHAARARSGAARRARAE